MCTFNLGNAVCVCSRGRVSIILLIDGNVVAPLGIYKSVNSSSEAQRHNDMSYCQTLQIVFGVHVFQGCHKLNIYDSRALIWIRALVYSSSYPLCRGINSLCYLSWPTQKIGKLYYHDYHTDSLIIRRCNSEMFTGIKHVWIWAKDWILDTFALISLDMATLRRLFLQILLRIRTALQIDALDDAFRKPRVHKDAVPKNKQQSI